MAWFEGAAGSTPRAVGVHHLRAPEDGDVDWVVQSCRDPETQRWLPMLPKPYGPADAESWIRHCQDSWAVGSATPFIILDSTTGDRLGTIELRTGDAPPDVGYWLAPEGRGRGAMTRALRLIVRYAFQVRGLHRVELFTLTDNVRSQAVAERCGFQRVDKVPERIASRDETRHDAFRYVLDAPLD